MTTLLCVDDSTDKVVTATTGRKGLPEGKTKGVKSNELDNGGGGIK